MSQKIDPREVLIYLNELGYTNINAQQLKEFITDLKKLIKYEFKHGKENVEHVGQMPTLSIYDSNHESQYGYEYYSPKNHKNLEDKQNENAFDCLYKKQSENVFDSLYKKPTVSSRAKEIPKRERQISVHITKATNRNLIHDHCIHVQENFNNDKNYQGSELQLGTDIGSTNGASGLVVVTTESTIKSIRPDSSRSLTGKSRDPVQGSLGKSSSTKITNSKSAFIRSGYTKPVNKCDPVALYHHYQAEWKKQKFPGQETHSNLRWAVREKLSKGPKVVCTRSVSSVRGKSSKT